MWCLSHCQSEHSPHFFCAPLRHMTECGTQHCAVKLLPHSPHFGEDRLMLGKPFSRRLKFGLLFYVIMVFWNKSYVVNFGFTLMLSHRKISLAQTHKYVFSNMVKVPMSGSLNKIRNQWQAIQRNHPPWPRNGENHCNFGGNMNQSPHNNLLVWHWMFSLIFHNWTTEVWEFTTNINTQKTLQCKYIFLKYFLLNKF